MSRETLLYERREDGVAVVTLNRPERLNAINGRVLAELEELLDEIERDERVRVFLLTGTPRRDGRPCFSAGFDLKSVGEGVPMERQIGRRVADRIDDLLKPSIAVVDGICSTGGSELAVCCDLRLVGSAAQISDWHLKNLGTGLGGWGASTRWARLIGAQKTKELFLTGRVFDAEEAVRIGWAVAAAPSEQLMDEALEMAGRIAGMNPGGVRMVLMHVDSVADTPRDAAIDMADRIPGLVGVSVDMGGKADAVLGAASKES
jgi:enoyl-CoA hydratase